MQQLNDGLVEAAQGMLPTKQCIPTNDLLFGPLSAFIQKAEGAMGGLFFGLVVLVIVVLAVISILTVLNKEAQKYLRLMALAAAIPLITILIIVVYNAFLVGFNNIC